MRTSLSAVTDQRQRTQTAVCSLVVLTTHQLQSALLHCILACTNDVLWLAGTDHLEKGQAKGVHIRTRAAASLGLVLRSQVPPRTNGL